MIKELSKFSFIFWLVVLFIFFVLPFSAGASSVSQDSIYLNMTPQNPGPGEGVTLTLSSYSVKLDNFLISWSVNNKNISSGVGKKTFSLNAPSAGESLVTATIALSDGQVEKTATIKSSAATILWQANDSYTPPFYKGKALPSPGSQVKVVFMPEMRAGSQTIDPKNLIYSWKKDFTNNPDGSGYGKNSFIFTNDYLDDSNNINVDASTVDQKNKLSAAIEIKTYDPVILFYKYDPTMGTLFSETLKDKHKISENEIIEAIPYYISPKDVSNPFLVWSWYINTLPVVNTGARPNLLPVASQPGVSGTANIKLELNNIYKLFTGAAKEINVEF